MSKLSFRARQVDHTKPLPIYFNNDLPDLQDFAAINRSVPQMPTGMEKEEETEHHLQRILSAQQAFGATSANEYAIPTPKVEIDNKMYERIYNVECPKHKQYIRIQPFSSDFDYPDYDVDYEDEEWINDKRHSLPDDFSDDLVLYFECIMDRLEKATTHSMNLPSLEEAKMLLLTNNDDFNDENDVVAVSNPNFVASFPKKAYKKERDDFILCIYDYWKAKRLKYKHPLTPIVLTDKSGVVTQPNNPFLVFRRRTEKMQTRKNRKTEEQSYEKMLILKRDLHRAQQILKLIKKRENIKKEFLKFTAETFEKRFKLNDYDGSITESIACSLKPASLNAHLNSILSTHPSAGSFSNLSNFGGTKSATVGSGKDRVGGGNGSNIDNKIANLIHSNRLQKPLDSKQRLPFNTSSSMPGAFKANEAAAAAALKGQQLSKSNKSAHRPVNNVSIKTLLDNNQRSASMGTTSPDKMSKKESGLSAAALAKMRRQKGDLDSADSSIVYDGLKTKEFYDVDLLGTAGESGAGAVDESGIGIGGEVVDLDSVLDETRNKLSTSNEKDGYWCFKRKEGCQYLLQRGSIFKNDIYDHDELFRPYEPADDSNVLAARPRDHATKRQHTHSNEEKLDELQRYYYGYAITRKHRHLGLVRRRMGRGGRIVLDRFPETQILSDSNNNNNSTQPPPADLMSADPSKLFAFDFAAYRTYYPKDCFNLNASESEFRKVESGNFTSDLRSDSSSAVVPAVTALELSVTKTADKALSDAFQPPPLKRSKLKFRSSFEDLVQDLNEDDRANNYYGLDDDSDSMDDDECTLDRFFGNENEKERLFDLPAAAQFQGETIAAAVQPATDAVTFGHQRFNDYQMKILDEKFSDKADEPAPVVAVPAEEEQLASHAVTARVEMDETMDRAELDDTNFTYNLNDTFTSSDQEDEKLTLDDFFSPDEPRPLEGNKAKKMKTGLIQLDLSKELNTEYWSTSLKRKELPIQVAKLAIKTLITMSMVKGKGIEVTVDVNGATESSFKDEDTPQPPAKKKITDPDNLNDIFDSVINYNKETDEVEGAKEDPVAVAMETAKESNSNSSDSNSNSSESATEAVSALTTIKAEPMCAEKSPSPPVAPPQLPPPPPARVPVAESSSELTVKPPLTPAPTVINSVRLTMSNLVANPNDLLKLNAAKLAKPLSSINSLLNNNNNNNNSSSSSSKQLSASTANPTTPSMVNGPVAASILSTSSTNNIILNGLIAKRKDEGSNYNGYNHSQPAAQQQQQESPSSTTALVAKPSTGSCSTASSLPKTPDAVVSSSNSSSTSTSINPPPKINTNLSSHLQMNDNKNYHNLNVNNFMQHKKNVEAVMSLTSGSNVVSSTTTNENLPILTVVESTQTSTNTDSNKSNVKPMEVT